jgi:DNA-binding transcriptional regulator YhcF (GntR family)
MYLSLNRLNSKLPKYKQIITLVENAIVNGELKIGDKLPSLNHLRNEFNFSRDTVISAYNELRARGIIYSIVGKGYFIYATDVNVQVKILLLFDELNAFKEDLYNSFLEELGSNFQVDLFFHHFSFNFFAKLIKDNVGNYGYYVIMPANLNNASQAINILPKEKTYILDQTQDSLSHYPSIFQNFEKYIYEGLTEVYEKIHAYKKLILIFEKSKQPDGIKRGFELFCNTKNINYKTLKSIKKKTIRKGEVYFTLDDKDLIKLIKKLKQTPYKLGKDVGIISYNDTMLKEILEGGITTISTDFKFMGSHLAKMLKENVFDQIENPKKIILRNSL